MERSLARTSLTPTSERGDDEAGIYHAIPRRTAARVSEAAEAVRDRIIRAIKRLQDFPRSGRSWRTVGTLELVIPGLPYVVIYEIDGNRVVVLTLFHTSRDFGSTTH